ncbi:MAG: glycosyltransferase [Syntrophotaleaceae bacterium]
MTPEQPFATGNWISARRQAKGLENLGHSVLIVPVLHEEKGLADRIGDFSPDVVNVLHAYRCGYPWLACPYSRARPWTVTLTGTDVNQGLHDPGQSPVILRILAEAGAIITINPLTREQLALDFPEWRPKLHHVPPAVDFGQGRCDLRRRLDIPSSTVLFLHPAGLRPVKGNRDLLDMFDRVAPGQDCRLVFCGPVLDRDYAESFLQAVRERPWAVYAGEIEPDKMTDVLRAADVVLGNSSSEGFSNSLQEAACLGVPILARNIPGNRVAFQTGRQGLLYDSAEEFTRKALDLLQQPELRRRLSRPMDPPQTLIREAVMLDRIFRQVSGGKRPDFIAGGHHLLS